MSKMGSIGVEPGPAAAADAGHSRFVQRVRRRYAAELALLPPGVPAPQAIDALIERLQSDGRTPASALRTARQVVLERLAVLDIECAATLSDVTSTMTALAECTLERALAQAQAEEDARYGAPLNEQGERIDFWIVGMG